jgi:hypothetical protein
MEFESIDPKYSKGLGLPGTLSAIRLHDAKFRILVGALWCGTSDWQNDLTGVHEATQQKFSSLPDRHQSIIGSRTGDKQPEWAGSSHQLTLSWDKSSCR